MQLKYDSLAREKSVYIVSACGFDSIPGEMGLKFHRQHFDGELNSVDCCVAVWVDKETNFGTKYSCI